jgi:hypothetical protein
MKLIHGQLTTAGGLGLLAAILVGAGEFLLHFDALGRFAEGGAYEFMHGINAERTTIGHFLGVLSAPLYIVGFWHLNNQGQTTINEKKRDLSLRTQKAVS